MTRRQSRVLALLTLSVFFFAMLLGGRLVLRFDVTRSRANTLSAVSRNLHEEISGEVRITYYISDRLRAASPVPDEIEGLLREYAAWSRGKIALVFRDPAKAHLEDRIEEMGILPRRIDTIERDRTVFAAVYTGVVIEYLDRIEVIPFVFSPDTLEYDLTSRIRSLLRDRERSIGVIVGDSSRSWNGDYGFAGEALLRSGWRVRELRSGEEIPETLSVLLVLGGAGDLDEWALYRIDSFIRGGGNVFFALEGVSVDSRTLEAKRVNDRGLLAMASSYGAAVREELVLDRPAGRAL
ncbi:MAG: GldG family protein, partial [Treponema sp.]|nr:GldG family protein [Treponema sp.]